jgi:hypothetical protein
MFNISESLFSYTHVMSPKLKRGFLKRKLTLQERQRAITKAYMTLQPDVSF